MFPGRLSLGRSGILKFKKQPSVHFPPVLFLSVDQRSAQPVRARVALPLHSKLGQRSLCLESPSLLSLAGSLPSFKCLFSLLFLTEAFPKYTI